MLGTVKRALNGGCWTVGYTAKGTECGSLGMEHKVLHCRTGQMMQGSAYGVQGIKDNRGQGKEIGNRNS